MAKALAEIDHHNSLPDVKVFRIFPGFWIFWGIENAEIRTNYVEFSHLKKIHVLLKLSLDQFQNFFQKLALISGLHCLNECSWHNSLWPGDVVT